MRVTAAFFERLHLDKKHLLLTGRAVLLLRAYFDMIDVRKMESLDDIEFVAFLSHVTDLNEVGQRNMCDVARL
jgi:hypothetical protein